LGLRQLRKAEIRRAGQLTGPATDDRPSRDSGVAGSKNKKIRPFHSLRTETMARLIQTLGLLVLLLASPAQAQDLEEILTGLTYDRSEEHTSELQSRENLVCRLLLEKKNQTPR